MWYLDILLNFHELDAGGFNRVAEEDDAALLKGSLDPLKVARAGGGNAGCFFKTPNCCPANFCKLRQFFRIDA